MSAAEPEQWQGRLGAGGDGLRGSARRPPAESWDLPNPTTWLVLSILATMCCCLPFGIAGIVYSALAMGARDRGDLHGWRDNVSKAKSWTLIAFVLGLVTIVLYACVRS